MPFPPLAERFERLEETLQIVRQMWSDDNGLFQGRHYQLAETLNSPQPPTRPHPPILIGGGGEKKTLRLVAKYADAWNIMGDLETVRRKTEVLREHCEREGRDFGTITKTLMHLGPPPADAASTESFLKEMEGYAALGFDEVHLMPFGPDPRPVVSYLGEHVVPRLAAL